MLQAPFHWLKVCLFFKSRWPLFAILGHNNIRIAISISSTLLKFQKIVNEISLTEEPTISFQVIEIDNYLFLLSCRFSIATELTETTKYEGELGLAGILVWMRFMATRQLTWNKNYNVKPRYSWQYITAFLLWLWFILLLLNI